MELEDLQPATEGTKEIYLNIRNGKESATLVGRCLPRYRNYDANAIPTEPIAMAILGLYGWEGQGGLVWVTVRNSD